MNTFLINKLKPQKGRLGACIQKVFTPAFLVTAIIAGQSMTLSAATSPNGREYSVEKDGLYYAGDLMLTLVDADWIENLVIPAGVDDKPVVAIADEAFKGRIDIETLTVPATIENIGSSAFYECESLASIDLSSATNLNLGATAFYGTLLCDEVKLPSKLYVENSVFNNSGIRSVDCEFAFTSTTGFWGIFNGCQELVSAKIKIGYEYSNGKKGDMVLPRRMFYQCKKLETVVIEGDFTGFDTESFSGCSALKSVSYASTKPSKLGDYAFSSTTALEELVLNEGIVTVGTSTFYNSGVKELNVPASLTTAPSVLFKGAANLERIIYPSLEKFIAAPPKLTSVMNTYPSVFIGDEMVTELTIPTSTAEIPAQAFMNLSGIRKVIIPNSSTAMTINNDAFKNCTDLVAVEIGAGKTTFGERSFADCQKLQTFSLSSKNKCTQFALSNFEACINLISVDAEGITVIGQQCFKGTTNLTTLNCPSVTTIGLSAFDGSGIITADFPLVESVGFYAFKNCNRLVSANLPKITKYNNLFFGECPLLESISCPAVTEFEGTFLGCASLKYINFDLLESLGTESGIFGGCTALEHLRLPALKELATSMSPNIVRADFPAIENFRWGSCFKNCAKLKSVNIPMIREIPQYTFSGCEKLDSIDFTNITTIGILAFENCKSFTSISAPALQSIGAEAFQGCSSLESFEFGQGQYPVSAIGSLAFKDCTSLVKFVCHAPVGVIEFFPPFENMGEGAEVVFKKDVERLSYFFIDSNVASVVFEGNVGTIGDRCFYNATNLQSVTFKGTVGEFVANSFRYCTNVKTVKIGNLKSWLTLQCGDYGNPSSESTADVDFYHVWANREDLIKDLVVPFAPQLNRLDLKMEVKA